MVRRLRGPVLGLLVAAGAAGCVSMPSGGPVLSYTVTPGPAAQSQHYQQIVTQPPGNGWAPDEIVRGFLTASASFADRQRVARQYLTPQASKTWNPSWTAIVYSNTPTVNTPVYPQAGPRNQATVTVTGKVQASLFGDGRYAVPSASAPDGPPLTFQLVKTGGQWRISVPPPQLLLTSDLFRYDYQLRNLYFFDPTGRFLVPDPVYVPLQATPADLMNGLVHDLITPPKDWLSRGATRTAFPAGTTRIGDVTLDGGTAAVNLGGAITKAPAQVLQEVSAQLLWTLTLSGSGQVGPAVQSVELYVGGKPWTPPNSDENPVQSQRPFNPPTGASNVFYYLDGAGNLQRRDVTQRDKTVRVARIGAGYSQIAVSPDDHYLAALRAGSLFIGPLGGRLAKRDGAGYTSMSWDPAGNLWATVGDQIVMLRGAAGPGQPQGQQVSVSVVDSDGNPIAGPFTALRVAPDGVRVAIIVGGSALDFGAIVSQEGARAGQAKMQIVLSPFYVSVAGTTSFSAVTWYGPDYVITLGSPGPVLTEYRVDGGGSNSISPPVHIKSITASKGYALIAGLGNGGMMADPSLTGSWMNIGNGTSPAYPG